jgi:chemotaxis protein histidine kinase CheA
MTRLEGGLAAVVIQDLAKQIKESAEQDLDQKIRNAASRVLGIDLDLVPARLITALSRGGTSKASRQRAADAIDLVRGRSASSSQGESSLSENVDAQLAIDEILEATEDDRRETHALRTQASFIRGVCRPLYAAWMDDIKVSEANDLLPREYLERKQEEMINFPIQTQNDLTNWVGEMFERFERLADVKQESGGSQGLVNKSAVRTYRNAWIGFASANMSRIWDEMIHRDERGVTTKQERDERFHRQRDSLNYSLKNLIVSSDMKPSRDVREPAATKQTPTTVTITLEELGNEPFKLKKSWPSIKVANQELVSWLDDAQKILGEMKVDIAKLEVTGTSGTDEFSLQEVPVTGIYGLFTRYLTTKG